jgi:hypothetical protein
MFLLERPSMAVNDRKATDKRKRSRRFQLLHTWDIEPTESRTNIISTVAAVARSAPGGKLKHLVLNSHASPGFLNLGEGFGTEDIPAFGRWRGLIEKIWLPNCRVAAIPDTAEQAKGTRNGHAFCSGLAGQVQCYVVASTERQIDPAVDVPRDMITSFEGLVLSYGPGGNVTWERRYPSTFLGPGDMPSYNP